MNMRADLLPSLSGPKDSDDRNFWLLVYLRRVDIASEQRIKTGGDRLVMINAIEPYAEKIHDQEITQAGGRKVL
jgi:hypothetical protein